MLDGAPGGDLVADTKNVDWQLSDDDFGTLASAKHRTVAGSGKADIGGRLRVATILRKAGVATTAHPERIAGSTNEVWRSGDLIIRVGNVPGVNRLRREAKLSGSLPWGVNYPTVVASGEEAFGEWLIVKNRSGLPLSECWASLDRSGRRRVVHELAETVKEIHAVEISPDIAPELTFDPTSTASMPHQMSKSRLIEMLEEATSLQWMDKGLVDALIQKTEETSGAFDGESINGLVHGDLHFENVLVRDAMLLSVLDFEWCRPGFKEIDLDVLARFCAHPDLTVGGASKVQRDSYRPVLGWVNEVYPELFAAPRLRDRLMFCSLAAEVPWLLTMPPDAPSEELSQFHPVNRLRELLEHGVAAERLGWTASGY